MAGRACRHRLPRDGGYIIVPPSARHIDGEHRPYRVDQFATRAVRPMDGQRLRDFLDPKPPVRWGDASGPGRTPNAERLAAWVARRPEGERNLGLFKAACRLAEHGTPPWDALDTLGDAAARAGLGEREITRTIGSAYRHVHTYGPGRRAPIQDAGTFSPRPEPATAIARGW